ncbi:AAA family ATPase [Longispora sp. K20-0274]|uniref:helix-turn-helix transcriptional regulator n=1 Tax=Longispora sp. K20-0274 TaxID=3088255 RepID=UPI00399BF00E
MDELVGREESLAEIRAMLEATVAGRGGCVVVEGPAGIGKTRMVRAAGERADALGVTVASGRAAEVDRAGSVVLMTALRGIAVEAAELAELAGHEDNWFGLVARLGAVIETQARIRPVLIVVDDAQWADELTGFALRVLVPRLANERVGWLLTRRSAPAELPAQGTLDRLIAEGAKRVTLGPLDDDAVVELCAQVLGARPDATVSSLAAGTGRNPFLLRHLLRGLVDAGQILINRGTATVIDGELPQSFLAAVSHRLRGLTALTRRMLGACAVLGRPFTAYDAAALIGSTAAEVVPAIDEAIAHDLLTEQGVQVAFTHDLIREAVYNTLSGPVRGMLHREAAAVRKAQGASPVEVAEHLVRGGSTDPIEVLHAAAQLTGRGSPGAAADLVLRMLDLLGEFDPARPGLAAEAVRLLASAGRMAEARELGETALRGVRTVSDEAAILVGLAEASRHAGQPAMAVEYIRRALAMTGLDDARRAHLLAVCGHGLLDAGDLAAAGAMTDEAIALAESSGTSDALVLGLSARSVLARAGGELDRALVDARDAVAAADRDRGAAAQRHPRLWLGRVLVAQDRFTEAEASYTIGQREADRLGTAWSQPLWHLCLAQLRLALGRLGEAQAEAEAGIQLAEQLATPQLAVRLLCVLARIALRKGDVEAARAHVNRTQELFVDGIGVAPAELTYAMAMVRSTMGQHRVAMETLGTVYQDATLFLGVDHGVAAMLVRLAMRAGATDKATAVVAMARRLAEQNPSVASLAGAAAHADGLLRGDLAALRIAVRHFQNCPRALARASAVEDLGVAELAAGNESAAAARFEEALGIWVGCGATGDADRVRERKARLRPDAGPGWSSLTEAELRVVRLVTEGLTNRETATRLFLSPHTVDSHLRHAFSKLGIKSRVELTRQFFHHREAQIA